MEVAKAFSDRGVSIKRVSALNPLPVGVLGRAIGNSRLVGLIWIWITFNAEPTTTSPWE